MEELHKRLDRLEKNIRNLVHLHQTLKEENEKLDSLNRELKKQNEEQLHLNKQFQEKIKLIKIMKSVSPDEKNNAELKRKINEYIREIDRCIALVNG